MSNNLPTAAFTLHSSFSPLLPLYHTFLLDQFGVIHNGSESLHGAVNCIELMNKQQKKMAILSNTSSPSHVAKKRLVKYGLREELFAGGLVSSGEECAKYIRQHYCGDGNNAKKALWLTWKESEKQNPMQFLTHCEEGSGAIIDVATSVDEADFILLHGSEVWRRCRDVDPSSSSSGQEDNVVVDLKFLYDEDYTVVDEVLQEAAKKGLPMICANPDLIVGFPNGVVGNMPGKIANRYETMMGGKVHNFGKPNPRHFHSCLENLGMKFDVNSKIGGVAHVGDSLHHDVVGANAAGIDSIFVLGGIHAKELGLSATGCDGNSGIVIVDSRDPGREEEGKSFVTKAELIAKLNVMFEEAGVYPTHVVPSLSLGAHV
ncbi:haloacid dehalogenase family hydrolase [Skeletonema marinoi]|uniref:Haloacid dehalogenase family hydrolase n=1 Tax=Skeletonema marinoi TaxID=267567 RepID=A0AAD9D6A6_9STRA|nr:haloacid dehalogenase family hydrolase [Skeletonema marinoi]